MHGRSSILLLNLRSWYREGSEQSVILSAEQQNICRSCGDKMVLSWGLGGGVEPGSQSAAPGVWVSAADRGRFVVGGLQVPHRALMFARVPPDRTPGWNRRLALTQVGVPGLAQGGTSVQTGSSLKLSTGTWLWNGGARVPRHDDGSVSLYGLLFGRHPDEPAKAISTAPSGVRCP